MNADLIRRWLQLGQLVAGVLTLAAGVVQLGFSRPFRKDGNRPLVFLGVTGLLYGTRLLADLPQIQELIPAPPLFWRYIDAYVTYVILVPTLYFIELTIGAGWRQSIRWMRRIATVYAVTAMAIDALTATPAAAKGPNGHLALAAIGVVIANTFRARTMAFQGFRVVRVGALVFGAFVLFENSVRSRWLPSDARGNFFGSERLRAFARNERARDAGAFVDALVGHVSEWTERAGARRFEDDVTVVVVDRLPQS